MGWLDDIKDHIGIDDDDSDYVAPDNDGDDWGDQYGLNAMTAGDMQKMTGSAKVALAGGAIASLAPAALVVPVVGTVVAGVIAAVGAAVALFGKLFGNRWHYSTGVRWLIQLYQFYVLGDANVTSSNKVDENYLQDCYNWFTAVLGVPIYDKYRLCWLKGTTLEGDDLNLSYTERATRYMTDADEAVAQGVTFEQAYAAAMISDTLPFFPQRAGAWADLPFAKFWFEKISPEDIAKWQLDDYSNDLLDGSVDTSVLGTVKEKLKGSFLLIVLGGLVLFLLLFRRRQLMRIIRRRR